MSQQNIHVVKCTQCSLYQVDFVKKTNKWACKVCHVKQIVEREFFRGSGAECRAKVQQLNLEQGQMQLAQDERTILQAEEQDGESTSIELEGKVHKGPSKWADYVDESIPENTPVAKIPQLDMEEQENTSSAIKPSGSRKRTAQNEFVVNKKPFSKWQNFI